MSENVEVKEPTVKKGELTAGESFAKSEFAGFVVAPYQLDPSHTARLMARIAPLSFSDSESEIDYVTMIDCIADVYEYVRDNCVLPARRNEFVDLFRGDFEKMADFVNLYIGAVGESGRSNS